MEDQVAGAGLNLDGGCTGHSYIAGCHDMAAYPGRVFDVTVLGWRACPFVVVAVLGLVGPAPMAPGGN